MKTPEEMASEYARTRWEYAARQYENWWNEQGPQETWTSFLAGYQAAQPQWISVKDRLPDVGHRILVTHRNSEDYANLTVMEAWRISDDEYCLPEDYSILAHDVDYWMPLPEPPEEK